MALRLIEAYGIDPNKDMTRERLSVAESVNALKDRKIDAFFWVGGVPTPSITDLAATPGIKIKMIDHGEAVDAMNKKYGPLYVKSIDPGRHLSRAGQGRHRGRRRVEHRGRDQRQDDRTRWRTSIAKAIVREAARSWAHVHKEAAQPRPARTSCARARRSRSIPAPGQILGGEGASRFSCRGGRGALTAADLAARSRRMPVQAVGASRALRFHA